jgi:hypothetical protein
MNAYTEKELDVIDEIVDFLTYEEWEEATDFWDSAEQALKLPIDDDMSYTVEAFVPNGTNVFYCLLVNNYKESWEAVSSGSCNKLAPAICLAWLNWKKLQIMAQQTKEQIEVEKERK